ncbi:MAG: hypothetical protein Q8N01_02605 [Sulfuricurvum sp.]|nr:hypothetical protein [Sulfuricurvum sp.]
MKTLTLKIEDSAVDKVMWFLEHLKDVVTIDTAHVHKHTDEFDLNDDPLAQELKKRIQEIDDGTVELIPHAEVMRKVYAKWEQKCT